MTNERSKPRVVEKRQRAVTGLLSLAALDFRIVMTLLRTSLVSCLTALTFKEMIEITFKK